MRTSLLLTNFKNSHKLTVYLIMFVVGFLLSFLLFYLFRFSFLDDVGSWEQYVDKAVGQVKISGFEVFTGALIRQAKGYIILWLFAGTVLRLVYIKLFSLYKGFTFGFLFCVLFVNHGFKSLLLFGTMLFPQCIAYVLAYLATFYMIGEKKEKKNNKAGIAVCVILLIVGCILEGYVNLPLIKSVY